MYFMTIFYGLYFILDGAAENAVLHYTMLARMNSDYSLSELIFSLLSTLSDTYVSSHQGLIKHCHFVAVQKFSWL